MKKLNILTGSEAAGKFSLVQALLLFLFKKVENYKAFGDRMMECFLDIVFYNNALKYVKKLEKHSDVVEELVRHLTILNDIRKKLFNYHNKDEKIHWMNLNRDMA